MQAANISYKPEYITEIQKKGIKRAELRLDSGAQGKLLVRKSVLTHPDLLSVLAHPDLLRILTLDKYFFSSHQPQGFLAAS